MSRHRFMKNLPRHEESEEEEDDLANAVADIQRGPKRQKSNAPEQRVDDKGAISSGIGFEMMRKMGWQTGTGIGASEEGRSEPVILDTQVDRIGLGRTAYEEDLHTSSTARPRLLDSQRYAEETDIERDIRLRRVEEDKIRASAVAAQRQNYRCDVCDKTYVNATKLDAHLSSHDHNHRVRLKELNSASQASGEDLEERLLKEKKREEKEMKRMQSALATQRKTVPIVREQKSTLVSLPNATKSESSASKDTSLNLGQEETPSHTLQSTTLPLSISLAPTKKAPLRFSLAKDPQGPGL